MASSTFRLGGLHLVLELLDVGLVVAQLGLGLFVLRDRADAGVAKLGLAGDVGRFMARLAVTIATWALSSARRVSALRSWFCSAPDRSGDHLARGDMVAQLDLDDSTWPEVWSRRR